MQMAAKEVVSKRIGALPQEVEVSESMEEAELVDRLLKDQRQDTAHVSACLFLSSGFSMAS